MSYHGCYSINNLVFFGSVGSKNKNTPITILNSETYQINHIETNCNHQIKTINSFNNYLILATDTAKYKNNLRDTYIKLYNIDEKYKLILLDEIYIPEAQVDGCVFYNELFFFTIHSNIDNCGLIFICKIINEKLKFVRKIKCNDFPHGIDICKDKLVYTSYSNESITIENLNKFIIN